MFESPQIGARAADIDAADLFPFFEMVGKGGSRVASYSWTSPATLPLGWAESRGRRMRRRGSAPKAEKRSAELVNLQRVALAHGSILAEIRKNVNPGSPQRFFRLPHPSSGSAQGLETPMHLTFDLVSGAMGYF